jgi:hypothetical protein
VSVCDAIQCSSKQAAGCRHCTTWRSSVACTYSCAYACVLCVSGNSYLYHHNVDPVNTPCNKTLTYQHGRAAARFDLDYQPHWYLCPAFLARKASRVVRVACGSVCFVEHYTGSISQFDNKYAAELEDIITNLLPTDQYEGIKAQVIRGILLSEEQCVRQLLMHEEVGGRSATQFLRHLRTLAGPSVPSDFLFTLWTNRLLLNIESIIAN